jgi:FAD/FMN-containing dehydrogenase/Fe-S oxidoreductase
MIPRLNEHTASVSLYAEFGRDLAASGFAGEITTSLSDRMALSTDNSIYRVLPECVVFPKNLDDCARVARIAGSQRYQALKLAPRGGGTGTNGQSLTNGIVVDMSRHMNRILHIDVKQNLVRVEAGVVKDQLNAALRPHGLFFAPELSTSNRATIGGMINTDASGQGSCVYGKTRHHVRSLTVALLGGETWTASPVDDAELARIKDSTDRIGAIHRVVDDIQRRNSKLIEASFPKLNRSLTGYDLAHIRTPQGLFDLTSILCGSEGTLSLLAEAELRVLPIPKQSVLIVVRYRDFGAALRDARLLMDLGPTSIETIDEKIVSLARSDSLWPAVAAHFPEASADPIAGVNLVEFCSDEIEAVAAVLKRADLLLAPKSDGRAGFSIVRDPDEIARIWALRKKAVGLLGDIAGRARPIPFVEDTAVPPEVLADYVAEFRAILDRHGLTYGMFGHVDAGVLHVRPALDMTDPAQRPLIRTISDEIFTLSRRYGGVLWGEHGKGVRSEYGPEFFGPLYGSLQEIKAAFDPFDQLNPGKIATAGAGDLLKIDEVPLLGERDERVPPALRESFNNAYYCNGNGACFDFDLDAVMCPSWKATRDRRHSPKGRATLLREWLRRLHDVDVDVPAETAQLRAGAAWRSLPLRFGNMLAKWLGRPDFSHAVLDALDGCVGCKGCAGQCPSKVDVPGFRARFLELYYGRYIRRPGDWLLSRIEELLPIATRMPRLFNAVMKSSGGRRFMAGLGLVALPALPTLQLALELKRRGIAMANPEALGALSSEERNKSVVIVGDAFTGAFEPSVLLDLVECLRLLGFRPWIAPPLPIGKPAHVQGDLKRFEHAARRTAGALGAIADTGVPLIGVDPAMTLTFRDEYRKAFGARDVPTVYLIQEWLAARFASLPPYRYARETKAFRLLPHCTELTNAARSIADWVTVFRALGLNLEVLPLGCCGMAGTFGHQARHRATSEQIYENSWGPRIAETGGDGPMLATGYSCRSQVKIMAGIELRHPVSALKQALEA